MSWTVLGFTDDMICGAWQDWRLARDFVRVWQECGRPSGFDVRQAVGSGDYVVEWYVAPAVAQLLDQHGVAWREFAIGECRRPPSVAREALVLR